jgi:hypothetical protein
MVLLMVGSKTRVVPHTRTVYTTWVKMFPAKRAHLITVHTNDEQPTEQLDAESATHPPNQKSINIKPEP